MATLEDSNIQAICLSETWITAPKRKLLQLDYFQLASCFCRVNREGGGVCILVKNNIDYKERRDILQMSIEFVFEICAVEINKLNLLIITLYWPNKNRESELFFSSLTNLLEYISIKDRSKNVIIGGDFNLNVLEPCNLTTTLLNLMKSFNFAQQVREPTRVTQNTSSCIDLVFSNMHYHKDRFSTKTKEYGLSDHKAILISIPGDLIRDNITWYTKKRIFSAQNIQSFKEELQKINWSDYINPAQSVNKNYTAFYNKINDILERTIPKTKIKIKTRKKNTWLTKGIRTSCKNKRLLKHLVNQTNSTTLISYYKTYEKTLKKIVQTSKKISYANKLLKSTNVTKTMWQIIKERSNKYTNKPKNNIQLNINNRHTDDPLTVANHFNYFFSTVGAPAKDKPKPLGRPVQSTTENSIYIQLTDPVEVFNIIKKLKSKRSFGFDEIPPILVKECAKELISPLSFLINQSFSEGIVPDLLKTTIIKPLHKKGDRLNSNNYRPIALLPTFAKVYESAMYLRVYAFCEKFKVFNDQQNGFRKGRSTALAVFNYINYILDTINNKKHAIGILLDMTKAYDRVLHNVLIAKLNGIGIRGSVLSWFISYLSNREQYVDLEHQNHATGEISYTRSTKTILTQSIPQGSVLGCFMFLIYINDLPKSINIPCTLFADDISLVLPCNDDIELVQLLNSNLTKLTNWLNDHNLEINFSKTKLMQFRPHQKRPLDINYAFNKTPIELVDSYCLLGIEIDSNLHWKYHIKKVASKLSSFTYALSELKRTTNKKSALCAYFAYAQSWLSYGVLLWGNSTDAKQLFLIQKKCIRIIANIDIMTSCRPYFDKLNILTLTSLYILEACAFVKNNDQLFPLYTRPEGLRPHKRLATCSSKLHLVHSGPRSMAAKIFNCIPKSIQSIEKINVFKNALNKYLVRKSYYTLQEFFDEHGKN